MEDSRSNAIVAGVLVGAVVVGAAVALHYARSHESRVADIDDVVEQARTTVQRLDEAVEMLRQSAGKSSVKA